MSIILPAPLEVPQQDSVEIRNRGSYTIPEDARKAHRLNLTVEIISVTRNQYGNFNYNPTQGDYCNVTYFVKDAPLKTRKVKYPKEVLIEWLNLEASILNAGASDVLVTATNMRTIAIAQGILLGEFPFTRPFTWAYPVTHLKFVCPPDTQVRIVCTWWPFEYPPFEFAQSEPNTGSPPGGSNEYSSPRQNSSGEPWEGNDDASSPDPLRDPRDFDDANQPPPPPDEPTVYSVCSLLTSVSGGGSLNGQTVCDNITVPYPGGSFSFSKQGANWFVYYDGVDIRPGVAWVGDFYTPSVTSVTEV